MPEELFDLIEEVFDEGKKRRRRSRKRNERERRETRPARRNPEPEPPAQPQSGGILGRLTGALRSGSKQEPQPQPQPKDHREELAHAYRQQVRLLEEMRRSVDEVVAAGHRLRQHAEQSEQRLAEFDARARAHLEAGREDLARAVLERKRLAMAQLDELEREIAELSREQEDLMRAEAELEAEVESLRVRSEVLQSQMASARAQARAREATAGLSDDFRSVATSVNEAERHVQELRARGATVDQMIDEGLLDPADPHGRFERQMQLSEVDADLERLKRQLGEGGSSTR